MCDKLFCVNKAFQVVIFSFFYFFDIELFISQSFLRVGRQKDRECSCRPDSVCLFLGTSEEKTGEGSSVVVVEDMQPELLLPLFMRKSSRSEQ